ncbi:hypothetical protein ACN23B_23920 [Anabaena sp. FACHB-709]|uniref:Transglycosylase SLT domain-containing protein n=2 Tax=Nostocaceae TaxID=1162 RepID=A0A1Z4KN44_ANAVA|nr:MULTISPECIES: hypothetical protein [Nostocaceae]BAY70372.1 hypothetical protein NIES23_31760 [Trichormus variabilis NIES-23]HBW29025.1 hypothetical protein [Nostoc sp. UBA8866]MBD2174309.1 hypothetical protein [Anabaena cylindrica FACHB-318]MBD2266027.1 hypothetical protein [Anabaena sp. FACHB-709]MBD2275401.1 hypothetical protein [Nostoc sp. PCC 7120 = FACHB-418]
MRDYLLRSLLVSGVVIGCGFSPLSAQAQQQQGVDVQVAALVEALRQAAPQTSKANDGYYSAWQVKPETLRGWSRTCLKKEVTPTQFENNPALARQVVSCITRRELNNQFRATGNNETAAVRGVACWWMTGAYTGCNTGFTATYVQKVAGFYQQQRANPSGRSR